MKVVIDIPDDEIFELVRKNYAEVNEDYLMEQNRQACKFCPNNPKNGGNGVCHCILGTPIIT